VTWIFSRVWVRLAAALGTVGMTGRLAIVGAKLLPVYEAEAKERMREGGKSAGAGPVNIPQALRIFDFSARRASCSSLSNSSTLSGMSRLNLRSAASNLSTCSFRPSRSKQP
jgi:hypothetical protein